MIVNEFYEIEILANKTLLNMQPAGFNFIVEDSIHETFPKCTFWLNDVAGVFQEHLMTAEGIRYQIKYGTTESDVKVTYSVDEDSLTELLSQGILNGPVKMKMVHEYRDTQEILSSAYEDRISLVVKKLVSKYPFTSKEINDTGNQSIWYQMLQTDTDFMRKVLLPNAFSNNAFRTPFFLFIDTNNVFHFQHYKSMIDRSPTAELLFMPQSEGSSRDPNVIRSLRRVHIGASVTYPLRVHNFYSWNYDDGSLEDSTSNILDHPLNSTAIAAVIDGSLTTGYTTLGYTESKSGRQEALEGRIAHQMRDTLFLDRFLIDLPLNTELRSGCTIDLNIRSYRTEDGTENSLLYRGKYLIESAKHSWDGKTQNGSTTLLISRKNVNVPSAYYIGNQLFKG